jgi:glyoxylase-like metal-dependent hydrolase (beta-lactamase superfamily II)
MSDPVIASASLEAVAPSLHATPPQRLSFARTLGVRAYLLVRPRGNLLVYATDTLAAQAPAIAALGGAARHYLNHWHEAAVAGALGAESAAPVYCHAADAAEVAKRLTVAATFADGHRVDDDFEAIPIPGHTEGATAYLWSDGRERCLFTGDSVFLRGGEWVGALLESSDRAAYVASLERLAELDFDRLVPWAASLDGPAHARTDRADAAERLGRIINRLRNGDDH